MVDEEKKQQKKFKRSNKNTKNKNTNNTNNRNNRNRNDSLNNSGKKRFKNYNQQNNNNKVKKQKQVVIDKDDIADKNENGEWIFTHEDVSSFIPQDPQILVSYINTKLRDQYKSLDLLCEDLNIDKNDLINKFRKIEYTYSQTENKFI